MYLHLYSQLNSQAQLKHTHTHSSSRSRIVVVMANYSKIKKNLPYENIATTCISIHTSAMFNSSLLLLLLFHVYIRRYTLQLLVFHFYYIERLYECVCVLPMMSIGH